MWIDMVWFENMARPQDMPCVSWENAGGFPMEWG
jgi:hypothetical protein